MLVVGGVGVSACGGGVGVRSACGGKGGSECFWWEGWE